MEILSKWIQCNHRCPYTWKREVGKSEKEMCDRKQRLEWCACCFWRWEDAMSQRMREASSRWKRLGNGLSTRVSRRNVAMPTIFFLSLYFLKFYFIFKLHIIVLVLPNIKMNPPQVYTCSPSWTLLPPPSPCQQFDFSPLRTVSDFWPLEM